MAVVTVPGAPLGTTLSFTYNNAFNTALAQSIANALGAASLGSSLTVNSVNGSGGYAANKTGNTGELVMMAGSSTNMTVGGLDNYSYLVDALNGADTIGGFQGLSVLAGDGNHTVINASTVVLGDGNNSVTETSTLSYNVAVGNGLDTISVGGSGTLYGGTGSDVFNDTGGTGLSKNVIYSQGVATSGGAVGDSILAGAGSTTVYASGASTVGTTIRAATGANAALTVVDSGRKENILGAQSSSLTVTNTGSASGMHFVGGAGTNTLVDQGKGGSTVNAGSGNNFITATGGANLIYGAATNSVNGSLNVVITAPNSTIADNAGSTGAFSVSVGGSADAVIPGNGASFVSVGATAFNAYIYGAGSTSSSTLNIDDEATGTAAVTSAQDIAAFNVTANGSGGGFFPVGSGAVAALVSGTKEEIATNYGTGTLSATVSGSNNPLIIGSSLSGGSVTITGAGTSNSIFPVNSKSAVVNVFDQGSNNIINTGYGTGADNVTLGGSGATVMAGAGATNVTIEGTGGTTGSSLFNLGGQLNFVGGSGSATVQSYAFFGAPGGTTIFGGSGGSNILYSNALGAGPLSYTAGAGNETLNAGTGTTNDTLAAGSGNVTMTAGSGATEFLFSKTLIEGTGTVGGGTLNLVTDFTKNAGNTVDITGYASGSGSVAPGASGSSILTLSDNTQITFSNTTTSQLTAAIHYS